MNCPQNENVCSVKKENESGYYRLHTVWKSDGFLLNVTSKNGAWRGEMTRNEIKTMSDQLDLEPDAYLKQCREALTTHGGQNGLVYAVENGNFTWKRLIDEDSGIKIKMGSVILEPASFLDTIQDLVTATLNCNDQLLRELNELKKEKEKVMTEKKELLNKLEEIIKIKDEMETDLYGRFLLLLNSKKKKILELQNMLGEKGKSHCEEICENKSEINPEKFYELDTDNDDFESEYDASETSKTSNKNLKQSSDSDNVNNEDKSYEEDKSPFGKRLKKTQVNTENQQEIPKNKSATNKEKLCEADTDYDDFKLECEITQISKSLNKKLMHSSNSNNVINDKSYEREKSPDGKKPKKTEINTENVKSDKSDLNREENEFSKATEENIPSTSGIPSTKEELLAYFYGP